MVVTEGLPICFSDFIISGSYGLSRDFWQGSRKAFTHENADSNIYRFRKKRENPEDYTNTAKMPIYSGNSGKIRENKKIYRFRILEEL